MGFKKDFLKDIAIYGLGNGIKKFISFFLLPFYTRALSPDEFGLLSTLGTFTMLLAAFLNFGLDSAVGYYFFQANGQEEKGKVLFTHFSIRVMGIVPPLILSFFSVPLSVLFFNTEDHAWLMFLSIMLVPINLLMSEQSHIYRYYRKPWSYNITTIVKSVVNIGVGVSLVLVLKWGVLGAQLASIISSIVVIIGSLILFSGWKYTWSFSFSWAKKMLKFGFPLIWAGLSTWVFNSIDRFFLLHYRNLEEVGYYSIANTLSQPVLLINMAVQMSFGVLFFKMYNEEVEEEKPKSKEMAVETYNIFLYGSVLLSSVLSIFGVDIVNLIATKEYGPGAIAIPFLTFSAVAAQSYQIMGPGITLKEKNWHYTWITVLTAIINIALNFIFIPRWGFPGAAFSTLLSFFVYWWIKQWVSNRLFQIEYPYFKILAFYLSGLVVSIIIPFLDHYKEYTLSIPYKLVVILMLIIMGFAFKFVSYRTLLNRIRG